MGGIVSSIYETSIKEGEHQEEDEYPMMCIRASQKLTRRKEQAHPIYDDEDPIVNSNKSSPDKLKSQITDTNVERMRLEIDSLKNQNKVLKNKLLLKNAKIEEMNKNIDSNRLPLNMMNHSGFGYSFQLPNSIHQPTIDQGEIHTKARLHDRLMKVLSEDKNNNISILKSLNVSNKNGHHDIITSENTSYEFSFVSFDDQVKILLGRCHDQSCIRVFRLIDTLDGPDCYKRYDDEGWKVSTASRYQNGKSGHKEGVSKDLEIFGNRGIESQGKDKRTDRNESEALFRNSHIFDSIKEPQEKSKTRKPLRAPKKLLKIDSRCSSTTPSPIPHHRSNTNNLNDNERLLKESFRDDNSEAKIPKYEDYLLENGINRYYTDNTRVSFHFINSKMNLVKIPSFTDTMIYHRDCLILDCIVYSVHCIYLYVDSASPQVKLAYENLKEKDKMDQSFKAPNNFDEDASIKKENRIRPSSILVRLDRSNNVLGAIRGNLFYLCHEGIYRVDITDITSSSSHTAGPRRDATERPICGEAKLIKRNYLDCQITHIVTTNEYLYYLSDNMVFVKFDVVDNSDFKTMNLREYLLAGLGYKLKWECLVLNTTKNGSFLIVSRGVYKTPKKLRSESKDTILIQQVDADMNMVNIKIIHNNDIIETSILNVELLSDYQGITNQECSSNDRNKVRLTFKDMTNTIRVSGVQGVAEVIYEMDPYHEPSTDKQVDADPWQTPTYNRDRSNHRSRRKRREEKWNDNEQNDDYDYDGYRDGEQDRKDFQESRWYYCHFDKRYKNRDEFN